MLSTELHQIAAAFLRDERRDHTLQATALVHEAFLRMIDRTVVEQSDQRRFVGLAARAMRQVLVDRLELLEQIVELEDVEGGLGLARRELAAQRDPLPLVAAATLRVALAREGLRR